MTTSFSRKYINATFALAQGSFDNGSNVVTLSGLRMSANIVKAGGNSKGETQLRVFGMTESVMNKLSTLGVLPQQVQKNTLVVTAGDNPAALSTVFEGTIASAWQNFQAMPEVAFEVSAYAGLYEAVQPTDATSYSGSADVVQIMQTLADQMSLRFENNGVSGVVLSTQYLPGSAWDKMQRAADAAGITAVIDDGTLSIWPANGSRGGPVAIVSPDTGMVGYPTFNPIGLEIMSLFNQTIRFGSTIQVQSSLQRACGVWQVHSLAHELDCETPNGKWFTRLSCVPPGYLATQ